jgi:hypothetical protein
MLVTATVNFCHKKGWSIARGRPKGEQQNITIEKELYHQLLKEFKEEVKEKSAPKFTQSKLCFTSNVPLS